MKHNFLFPVYYLLFTIHYFLPCIASTQEQLNTFWDTKPSESTVTQENTQYQQIRDKLLTNLFFRGELADKIIENNLHNTLIEFAGNESYADIRAELIKWIEQHPEEAARLFMHLKSGTISIKEISTRITGYKINPFFLGLVQDLVTASKDKSLSDEALSIASKRLFEGMPYDAYEQVVLPEQKSGVKAPWSNQRQKIQQITGTDFFHPHYADFKINTETLNKEYKLITNMFEEVQRRLKSDLDNYASSMKNDENNNILAKRENLFKQTFQMYQNFLISLSSFKGRKNITKKESELIEKERHLLRKSLALLHTLSRIYELNVQYDVLLKTSAGSEFQNILKELLNLKQLFMEYASSLENTQMQLSQIYAKLRNVEKLLFNWTLKFIVYDRFVRLKTAIERMNFSCILDKIISEYLMKFFPMSNYAKTKTEILEFSRVLDSYIKKISSGNFENVFSLIDFEKIMDINAKIRMISDFSKFNENIQFIFWDAFFNPFKITYKPPSSQNKVGIFSIGLKTLSYP